VTAPVSTALRSTIDLGGRRAVIHSLKLAAAGLVVGATAGAVLLLRWALRVAADMPDDL
jgi:hypothetical protein